MTNAATDTTGMPAHDSCTAAASPPASSDEASSPKRQRQHPRPKRKKVPTYYRRKAEMDRLEEECRQLEERARGLAAQADVLRPREALQRRKNTNQKLREVVHTHRLAFAGASSIISHYFREKSTGPFDTPTKLSRDPGKRQEELLEMRAQRLRCAYEFMTEQQRYIDVTLDFCEQRKFVAVNGDVCSERFEIVPLPGARSVRRVFDAVEGFMTNMEISMTEVDGDVTVRENDDPQASAYCPVAQHRFVTTFADSVQMDTNNAAFAEYRPAGPSQEEIGFSINDPIDQDEMYPYKPAHRVRQDVTVIIMVRRHADKDGKPLIVFSRWWSLRLRKSHIDVPKSVVERIRRGLETVSAAMLAAAERADSGDTDSTR